MVKRLYKIGNDPYDYVIAQSKRQAILFMCDLTGLNAEEIGEMSEVKPMKNFPIFNEQTNKTDVKTVLEWLEGENEIPCILASSEH